MVVDMEGASCVCSRDQVSKGSATHEEGRRLLTSDVNAAVEGAFAGGATDVLVADVHDFSFNLLPEQMDPRARVIYGIPHHGSYFPFLDCTVDVTFLLAHHAMAGTIWGTFEHTVNSGTIHRVRVNGREVGEIGLHAALAGSVGVPVVLVTGDTSACTEAESQLGSIQTVAVKQGLGRYRAVCRSLENARHLIREAAEKSLALKDTVRPFTFGSPAEIAVTFKNTQDADQALTNEVGLGRLGAVRTDGYTVVYNLEKFSDWYGGDWKGQHGRQELL